MVLRVQRVTLTVSPQLPRPDDRGGTYGYSGETDARKPHHHCRFPERSDVLTAAWRWEGVPRMCRRLRDVPGLSVHTQSDLSRRRMPDTPLLLRPCPPRGAQHLADTVHDVSRRVHGS